MKNVTIMLFGMVLLTAAPAGEAVPLSSCGTFDLGEQDAGTLLLEIHEPHQYVPKVIVELTMNEEVHSTFEQWSSSGVVKSVVAYRKGSNNPVFRCSNGGD
jgi:hypothetical protein